MPVSYEPFSEAIRANPYDAYRELRRLAPVHWAPEARAFAISRYDDVRFVLSHPELFSSDAMGGMLVGSAPEDAAGPAALNPGLGDSRILILMDPPQHSRLRNLVNRGFTPRHIAALESRLREIVEEAMAGVRGAEDFDVIAELAIPVPLQIIAEMLGVETERSGDFRRWSNTIIAGATGSGRGPESLRDPAFALAIGELSGYLGQIADERRRAPRDDLISTLVAGQDGEVGLTSEEVAAFALVLLIAGNETTTNLIGSLVQTLLDNPRQLELVCKDRSRIPSLIEEGLRYESPIQFLFRRATQDIELAGKRIPKNAAVLPLLGSANRDERVFERPDTFDITRDVKGHLALGFGVHFCLGASLARLEARVVMEALLDELPAFQVCSTRTQTVDSYMMRGFRRLELARVA